MEVRKRPWDDYVVPVVFRIDLFSYRLIFFIFSRFLSWFFHGIENDF